jgi:hypothetical protein
MHFVIELREDIARQLSSFWGTYPAVCSKRSRWRAIEVAENTPHHLTLKPTLLFV